MHAEIIQRLRLDVLGRNYPLVSDPKQYGPVQRCFEDAVRRMASWAYFLPASEHHHHSTPYGLFKHSLEVAQHLVTGFISSGRGGADPDEQNRERLALFIIGIAHDIGKIYGVTVTAGPDAQGRDILWKPYRRDTLAEFCERARTAGMPIKAVWKPNRGLNGLSSHEALGPYLLGTLVDRAVISWLGFRRIGIINMAILGTCIEDYRTMSDDLRKADGASVIKELQDLEAGRTVSYSIGDPNYGNMSLAEDFVVAFRRFYKKGLFDINVANGAMLISRSHTVLRLPIAFNVPTPFRVVADTMRDYFRAKKATQTELGQMFEQGDAPHAFEKSIAFDRCRDPSAREHWCVLDQALSTRGAPVIAHQVFVSDGSGVANWRCIIIRNDVLWGPVQYEKDPGIFRGNVWFTSHIDLLTLTVAPASVGFGDLPPELRPVPVRPRPLGFKFANSTNGSSSARAAASQAEADRELQNILRGMEPESAKRLSALLVDDRRIQVDDVVLAMSEAFPEAMSDDMRLIMNLMKKGPLPIRLRRPVFHMVFDHIRAQKARKETPAEYRHNTQSPPAAAARHRSIPAVQRKVDVDQVLAVLAQVLGRPKRVTVPFDAGSIDNVLLAFPDGRYGISIPGLAHIVPGDFPAFPANIRYALEFRVADVVARLGAVPSPTSLHRVRVADCAYGPYDAGSRLVMFGVLPWHEDGIPVPTMDVGYAAIS